MEFLDFLFQKDFLAFSARMKSIKTVEGLRYVLILVFCPCLSLNFFIERDLSNKMSQLLAPFEFELLSRQSSISFEKKREKNIFHFHQGDHPEFQEKNELPAALLYLKNRIFAVYDEKVSEIIKTRSNRNERKNDFVFSGDIWYRTT